MKRIIPAIIFSSALLGVVPAFAHVMLDHTVPSVGSVVATPPRELLLWFTQDLEPAFSRVEVHDAKGSRVDSSKARVDASNRTLVHVSLRGLSPGIYKVSWRVLSVDTHTTEGTFTFQVSK
jgi:hypothetical protein